MGWNRANLKKSIQLIGMAGICMIGVTGCMSKREMDQQAVEKFKEKYGVDCEVIYTDIIDDSVENRDEIHVYVDEYMEEGETAIIYSWMENGKPVSKDSLFGYIIREDYEKNVKTIAEQEFGEVKVFVGGLQRGFDDVLTVESTLEDAYALGIKITTYIRILVLPGEEKEDFEKKGEIICAALEEAQLNGIVYFYEVSEEAFSQVTRSNYKSVINSDPDGINVFKFYKEKSY